MAEDAEDRTEAATPRRLERAREEGNLPISREMPMLAGLALATLALMMAGPEIGHGLVTQLRGLLAGIGEPPVPGGNGAALRAAGLAVLAAAAPIVLAVALGGAAAGLLQTGFRLNPKGLRPDFSRLDPRRGLRRVAGRDGLVEAAKAVAKLAVLSWAAWRVLSADLPDLLRAVSWSPGALADRMLRGAVHLLVVLLGAQAAIAGADMLWVRLRHARSLRMSREELKDEAKETEGNPQIKARIRQMRMARARKRMMAAVPKATVVVTNPTHYAVALLYEREQGTAPRVVAKGVDSLAARIRAVAEESRVPIVPNPPLARALYAVDLDAEIPAEHFQAVAEVIAYVWRLRDRLRGLGQGEGTAARSAGR